MFDEIVEDIAILIKPVTKCSKARVELSFTILADQSTQIGIYAINSNGVANKAI